MNERIQELSEQAQLYARQGMAQSVIKGLDADTMSEKYAKDFEEKFAELIIREYSYDCMDVTSNSEHIRFVAKKWGVEI